MGLCQITNIGTNFFPCEAAGVNTVTSNMVGSLDSSKVLLSSDSMEISTVEMKKQGSAVRLPAKANVTANNTNFVVPSIVPRDDPDGKDLVSSRKEFSVAAKGNDDVAKPPHTRRLSNARFDMERMSVSLESAVFVNRRTPVRSKKEKLVTDDNSKESSREEQSNIKTVTEKYDKTPSMETPSSKEIVKFSISTTFRYCISFQAFCCMNTIQLPMYLLFCIYAFTHLH